MRKVLCSVHFDVVEIKPAILYDHFHFLDACFKMHTLLDQMCIVLPVPGIDNLQSASFIFSIEFYMQFGAVPRGAGPAYDIVVAGFFDVYGVFQPFTGF